MSWNYRVVRRTHNGEVQFGIHEAYHNGTSWTEDPVAPVADSVDDLRDVLAKMTAALEAPIIDPARALAEQAVIEAARGHAKWSKDRVVAPTQTLRAVMGAVATLDALVGKSDA